MPKRDYEAVDMGKYLFSLLIAILHIMGEIGGVRQVFPWVRMGVPIFFTLSGFLFFRKWKETPSFKETFLPFCRRNIRLYSLWSVILFPIWISRVSIGNTATTVFNFLYAILWTGTFHTSWFLIHLVFGVFLICVLSTKLRNEWTICIGLFMYLVCIVTSSYRNLFPTDSPLIELSLRYYPGCINLTFADGFFVFGNGKGYCRQRGKAEKPSNVLVWSCDIAGTAIIGI